MKAATAKDVGAQSIVVCIELKSPQVQEKTEGYIRAWTGFAEVEHISAEVGVLRLHPGGAAQLRKGRKPTSKLSH